MPLAAVMSCLGPYQTAAVYSTSIERLTQRGNSGATAAVILSIACLNNCIRRCISSMWYARFKV